jgi:hypothetical protein
VALVQNQEPAADPEEEFHKQQRVKEVRLDTRSDDGVGLAGTSRALRAESRDGSALVSWGMLLVSGQSLDFVMSDVSLSQRRGVGCRRVGGWQGLQHARERVRAARREREEAEARKAREEEDRAVEKQADSERARKERQAAAMRYG